MLQKHTREHTEPQTGMIQEAWGAADAVLNTQTVDLALPGAT